MRYELILERTLCTPDYFLLRFSIAENLKGKKLCYKNRHVFNYFVEGESLEERIEIIGHLQQYNFEFENKENWHFGEDITFSMGFLEKYLDYPNQANIIKKHYKDLIELLYQETAINTNLMAENINLEQAFLTLMGYGYILGNNPLRYLTAEDIKYKDLEGSLVSIIEIFEETFFHSFEATEIYLMLKMDFDLDIKKFKSLNKKIPTKDFLKWAVDRGFIKEMTTNENPTERDKRVAIVKKALITFLRERTHSITKHALSTDVEFHTQISLLGLVIDEEATKNDPDTITPTTLGEYLTKIITSLEWKDQPKNIQDNISYTPRPKK